MPGTATSSAEQGDTTSGDSGDQAASSAGGQEGVSPDGQNAETTQSSESAQGDTILTKGGSAEGSGGDEGEQANGEGGTGSDEDGDSAASIELALADGSLLDAAAMGDAQEAYAGLNLTPEQATALWDREQAAAARHQQALEDQFSAEKESWLQVLKDDPEFGGETFEKTQADAHRAFVHYGGKDEELVRVLNETGYGNHPLLVKAFARIGRDIGEDTPETGGDGSPGKKDVPLEELYYPKDVPKK